MNHVLGQKHLSQRALVFGVESVAPPTVETISSISTFSSISSILSHFPIFVYFWVCCPFFLIFEVILRVGEGC
jgi:hypothetical protein